MNRSATWADFDEELLALELQCYDPVNVNHAFWPSRREEHRTQFRTTPHGRVTPKQRPRLRFDSMSTGRSSLKSAPIRAYAVGRWCAARRRLARRRTNTAWIGFCATMSR